MSAEEAKKWMGILESNNELWDEETTAAAKAFGKAGQAHLFSKWKGPGQKDKDKKRYVYIYVYIYMCVCERERVYGCVFVRVSVSTLLKMEGAWTEAQKVCMCIYLLERECVCEYMCVCV
jgi:hypothetical protein